MDTQLDMAFVIVDHDSHAKHVTPQALDSFPCRILRLSP